MNPQDPRSRAGMYARGKNVYNGASNVPNPTGATGPQFSQGTENNVNLIQRMFPWGKGLMESYMAGPAPAGVNPGPVQPPAIGGTTMPEGMPRGGQSPAAQIGAFVPPTRQSPAAQIGPFVPGNSPVGNPQTSPGMSMPSGPFEIQGGQLSEALRRRLQRGTKRSK